MGDVDYTFDGKEYVPVNFRLRMDEGDVESRPTFLNKGRAWKAQDIALGWS
jgi:hypothetical protein